MPSSFKQFNPNRVPSPCFVIDKAAVERNLQILHRVQQESGAKVLAALKAFSCWSLAPLIGKYVSGTCASGLHEARLGFEEFGGEVHCYSAAYKEDDLKEILKIADHVLFNSFSQWERFKPLAMAARELRPQLQFGLRINPEHSEGDVPIYDPCAPCSRMGIPLSQFRDDLLDGISGLHFHTLCQQDVPPLARTVKAVEEKFGQWLPQMDWVNFGGGHHISREDYQVDELIQLVKEFSGRYGVQVYLEPGEAVAIHSGVLVTEVLDLTWNTMPQAILDTSATCHMPDVLEMPYRADVLEAGLPDEKAYTYRLGGMTCLAGDVIGDYSFEQPLAVGQRLMFDDMAHYTMVKTTTFNGINLPAIALWDSRTDELRVVREFGYDDFKNRLS
ncbi:carboxynorspermidine decarboxylase [Cellvibrio polysaccharolyticus]|uniref:Carboxynorspermidine/carboxyspermidine decarboxylase n=1 Tax=Cellvibrio polysaccharolyticus TaxID=2082724 RepID=A0A928V675_9GAMM|nr:carboxynorspermidine decarboxylase [Cellvibrio polysaccharolyticus]MBE8717920.1 carboxynorspermidine decarboxylase [Cellvibrio polysaccharolyticus]